MTDTTTTTETTTEPSNPYLTTLNVLGVLGIIGAIILALAANAALAEATGYRGTSSDLAKATALGAWADILGMVGVVSLVGSLVARAVMWRPVAQEPLLTDNEPSVAPDADQWSSKE